MVDIQHVEEYLPTWMVAYITAAVHMMVVVVLGTIHGQNKSIQVFLEALQPDLCSTSGTNIKVHHLEKKTWEQLL